MPKSFAPILPPTRLQFPDGSVLSIGTIRCDDQIHEAVYLAFHPTDSAEPRMELELPPKTVDVIIRQLQDKANQARYISGVSMLEYPEPHPPRLPSPEARIRKRRARKKIRAKEAAPPPGDSASPAVDSTTPEQRPSGGHPPAENP